MVDLSWFVHFNKETCLIVPSFSFATYSLKYARFSNIVTSGKILQLFYYHSRDNLPH